MSTYVVSDLHSQLNLWKQIQGILKPNDTLYCLGDCIDRGESGAIILLEMLADNRVILLKGNHEDFLENLLLKIIKKIDKDENLSNLEKLWLEDNGGWETLHYFYEHRDTIDLIKLTEKIKSLPTRKDLTIGEKHIILTHAGLDPWLSFKESKLCCSEGNKVNPYLWDRWHIIDQSFPKKYENVYVLHGHSPVLMGDIWSSMWKHDIWEMQDPNNWQAIRYCEGHKICIDMGAFYSRMTCLFDLENFKEIYIYDDNYYTRTEGSCPILTLKQKLD